MASVLLLPLLFIQFWFVDAPKGLMAFFASLNGAFLELFSLPLFIGTFFQPLKNEYREGLVLFSRGMGMAVKSVFIIVDLFLFLLLSLVEFLILLAFLALPFYTVYLFFAR